MVIFEKKGIFGVFSCFFSEMGLCRELRVFRCNQCINFEIFFEYFNFYYIKLHVKPPGPEEVLNSHPPYYRQ